MCACTCACVSLCVLVCVCAHPGAQRAGAGAVCMVRIPALPLLQLCDLREVS